MENDSHASQDHQGERLTAVLCNFGEISHSLLSDLSNLGLRNGVPSKEGWKRNSSGASHSTRHLRASQYLKDRQSRSCSTSFLDWEGRDCAAPRGTLYFDGPNDENPGLRDNHSLASRISNSQISQATNEGSSSVQSVPVAIVERHLSRSAQLATGGTWKPPHLSGTDSSSQISISQHCGLGSSNINFRLRPSQRPITFSGRRDQQRSADRFTSPRRNPVISREIFQFSKPAQSAKRARVIRRRGTTAADSRQASVGMSVSRMQDQNSRQVSSPLSPTVLTVQLDSESRNNRQVSGGSVWRVGGVVDLAREPHRRQMVRRSLHSNGRPQVHVSRFLRKSTAEDDSEGYRKSLALALAVNQSERVLLSPSSSPTESIRSIPISPLPYHSSNWPTNVRSANIGNLIWRDCEWMREDRMALLEAPHLRDDFYCSVLTYSHKLDRLAVALGCNVYLWSEKTGVIATPPALDALQDRSAYVTSIAFSSETGGRAILAVGRADGRVVLWSPLDEEPRYLKMRSPKAAAHISFRPTFVRRASQRHSSLVAENEVLLIGDDAGLVSMYFIEWPEATKRFLFGWHGSICLHARISVHSQQICGIAWSPNGDYFATGGNDNLCCLFQTSAILAGDRRTSAPAIELQRDGRGDPHLSVLASMECDLTIRQEKVKHQWRLNAAIKAIAFCPWQRGLLATGGGSNDRCIHFFHTVSGASLSAIDCAAQVTSLIWSETRREIAATFGFAQPEHSYRVAVYSWPSCQEIVAIPWMNEMRALHAIGYPGRPKREKRQKSSGTFEICSGDEGCIVVAGSDGSIKFHEIWSEARSTTAPRRGLLGGSDILESLHGIDKEGKDTIR